MRRRTLLAAAAALPLAACGGEDGPVSAPEDRITYGDDPSQYARLYRPDGTPRGVIVVIHGGFWKSQYGADLGAPLAESLAAQGWAAWNIEYRRVGNGGGTPETFDDVAAAIDALADTDLDTSTVITLGHSAGGHLAAWAAARGRYGWADAVPVTAVVSQAGVLDLRTAYDEGLGGGAVESFLGHPPTADDVAYDPMQQLPLDVPVHCVHGTDDRIVPIGQSRDYVAANPHASLTEVDGDHFVVIDPESEAWRRTLGILDQIAK